MSFTLTIGAGLAGTMGMTLFTMLAFFLLRVPYHVLAILGNMMLFKKNTNVVSSPPRTVHILAAVLHYIIGILFAYGYALLLRNDLMANIITQSLLYGIAIGTIGITGWKILFAAHPGPPCVLLRTYLPVIFLGHIVLAIIMHYVFLLGTPEAVTANIPLC
jgi:uncharacterized membrane protein YagU involved in acid resistance